jgi:hypothetical protein
LSGLACLMAVATGRKRQNGQFHQRNRDSQFAFSRN